jgi:hypothetical protein
MKRMLGGLGVVVAVTACLDVSVPPRTPLGPGSLRATVLTALPNRGDLAPAEGAKVSLVGTTLTATADADGNIVLRGLTQARGRVTVALDVDRDGVDDRSRLLTLEELGAGLGKDVNLGTLVLGRNGTLVGSVKRGDRRALASGHGGISVFLPQLPQLSTTGDDGTFVLPGVPEGRLVLNAYVAGYRTEALPVELTAGAEVRVAPLFLEPAPGDAPVGSLRGRVEQPDGTPIAAASVVVASGGIETRAETNAEGRFALEALPVGVYALGVTKAAFASLRVPTVLVAAQVTELGALVLTPGMTTPIVLDGGPVVPDAGSAGGTAGGAAGGSSGGSAGGASGGAAGGSSGGSAGGASGGAAGGSSGGSAGGASGGVAGGSSGGSAGGASGGAAGGSSGGSAGGASGGTAGGSAGPVAVVGPPIVVTPTRPTRLNGALSQGDQPLTYQWTQVSGPMVTLSDNNSPSADDPQLTAPAGPGQVLEFSLVVVDRFGRPSTNLAVARVAVGFAPTARFVPDGGLLIASVPTPLQSTSFDDGGLPLLFHRWTLTPGSAATLSTDGGPTALLFPAAVPFGAPDELAEVSLEVTNSIGVVSAAFARPFVVRGVSPNNWTLDAGPQGSLFEVFNTSTVVPLTGTLQKSVSAPDPSWSWACTPPQTLLGATSLTPSFLAPVVAGPDVQLTCSLTGTATLPLAPASQTAVAYLTLRDRIAPVVVRGLEEPTRLSRFGLSVEFNEDVEFVSLPVLACGGETLIGYLEREAPRIITYRTNTAPYLEGALCSATDTIRDVSPAQNTTNVTLKTNASVQTVWHGPYLSMGTFTDPRPVLASLGTFPKAQQRRWNVPDPKPAAAQLLVTDGSLLVPLLFDAYATSVCSSPCGVSAGFPALVGLPAGAVPKGQRSFWSGATMFVTVRPGVYAERSPAGSWSLASNVPGHLVQAVTSLKAVSQDGGVLNLWTRAETSSTFQFTESIASGVPPLSEVVGNEVHLVGVSAAAPVAMRAWDRGPSSWSERPLSAPPEDAGTLVFAQVGRGPPLYMVTHLDESGGFATYRSGQPGSSFSGTPYVSPDVSRGFHAAARGAQLYVASVTNGQLRLYESSWAAIQSQTVIPGPPRTGFSPPYPEPLNVNLACEAAAPHLTFLEDSLVITWQERCPPQTQWNVAVRVIR